MLGPATPLPPKKGLGSLWHPLGLVPEGMSGNTHGFSLGPWLGCKNLAGGLHRLPLHLFLQGPWLGAKALPTPPRWKIGRV